jgi:hypothetical protein
MSFERDFYSEHCPSSRTERTCFCLQARRRRVLSWDPQADLVSMSGPIHYIIMASQYVQPTMRLGFLVPESGRHKFAVAILQIVLSDTTFLAAGFLLFPLTSISAVRG